jgi:UDP-glucose 4-epimerase
VSTVSRYLVTGGAGFIGGAIARRLIERGHRVTVVDDLSTGARENVPAGADFVLADLRSDAAVGALEGRGVDAILHLGAQSSGEISHADPIADFDTNARGTFLLLRWAERQGIGRFLFASSMAVYGSTEGPVAEPCPPQPVSFYGASKVAAEAAVSMFGRQGGAPTIFRMFNVYGPGQNLDNLRQGMASIYLAQLLGGGPIVVKGSLDRYRDLVYIDDVVDAWLRAIEAPSSIGATYNVGTGHKTTVRALVDGLLCAAGHAPGTVPVTVASETPGDVHGSVADISHISRDLGWMPRVPLDEGLRRMVAWATTARR